MLCGGITALLCPGAIALLKLVLEEQVQFIIHDFLRIKPMLESYESIVVASRTVERDYAGFHIDNHDIVIVLKNVVQLNHNEGTTHALAPFGGAMDDPLREDPICACIRSGLAACPLPVPTSFS